MSESPETGTARDGPAPAADVAPAPAAEPRPAESRSGGVARVSSPAAWVAIAALALGAWNWYDARVELRDLKQELAKKLADTDTQNKESRLVAEQVREAVAEAQVKLGVLEARLAESQS